MTSLTLSIDNDLLQWAREAALRENTSVNALVRDFLGHSGNEAAIQSSCSPLFSETFGHGNKFGSLEAANPLRRGIGGACPVCGVQALEEAPMPRPAAAGEGKKTSAWPACRPGRRLTVERLSATMGSKRPMRWSHSPVIRGATGSPWHTNPAPPAKASQPTIARSILRESMKTIAQQRCAPPRLAPLLSS